MLTEGGETPPGMQRLVGKITPLLRCAPLATPRGRCHGIRRTPETGSRKRFPVLFFGPKLSLPTTGKATKEAKSAKCPLMR